jgi:hypothetical protein
MNSLIFGTLLALIASTQAHAVGSGGSRFTTCGPEQGHFPVRADSITVMDPTIKITLKRFYQECRDEIQQRSVQHGARILVQSAEGALRGPVRIEEHALAANGWEWKGFTRARLPEKNLAVVDFGHRSHASIAFRRNRATNIRLVILRVFVGDELAQEIRMFRPN